MRYWYDGEDEDYQRELQRIERCGGASPAPIGPLNLTCFALLAGIQVIGVVSAILAIVLC
jgi:hypothetical protein